MVVREMLSFRIEIDLNYLDITPENILLLGWEIESPLVLNFNISEGKLLNLVEPPEVLTFIA